MEFFYCTKLTQDTVYYSKYWIHGRSHSIKNMDHSGMILEKMEKIWWISWFLFKMYAN